MTEKTDARELWIVSLGLTPYEEALELQRTLAAERISGAIPEDILLLVEHPPVVTLGRSAKSRNLVSSPEYLASRGVELFEVERGGDVTFHGPGQLVGYPIIDLKRHKVDLHWYLRQVEEALIRTLAPYSIPAERNPGFTGVWTRGRKIASIGVHTRDWVTWHGFALNVTTELSYFDLIIPCGIEGVTMTSIEREIEASSGLPALTLDAAGEIIAGSFGDLFDLAPVVVDAAALSATLS
ncbi:MAG TPA: lipoyl(octanoyl) transferase LipB [Gemmatimonadaceae bacterium]|nr:lipoyl(octanoyl) transferase LipB [Gemmatimonadaceae bacterium]